MRRKIILSLFLLIFVLSFSAGSSTLQVSSSSLSRIYSSYLKGILAEKYQDFDKALNEYLQAEKLDEGSFPIRLRLAVQYMKLEEFEKAESLLKNLEAEKPLNMDACLLLIFLYTHQGKEEEANREYENMLGRLHEEDPENVKITESLAQFKLKRNDFNEAMKLYEDVVKLSPADAEARFWLGYLYEEEGFRHKAIEQWKKAIELKPDHVDALNALGYTYAEEGIHLDKAESYIKKALELRPEQAAYLDSLGWVYFKKGQFLKAKKYIEKAADKLRDPVIMQHLGEIYYRLGEFENAKKTWENLINNDSDNKEIIKKLESIEDEISLEQN